MTQETESGTDKKKIKILCWSIFSVLALVLITGGIIASMIYENVPIVLDHNYLKRSKEREPFIPFHVMKKGQNNYDIMVRSKPGMISKISYDDDEFNYILRNVLCSNILKQSGASKGKRITAKRTSLILKQGVFHLKHTYETPYSPFGKYLNLYLTFKISIKNGKESMEILTAKAGSYNVPKFIMKAILQNFLEEHYYGTSQERVIKKCIIDLHINEKGIFAEYYPFVLKQELKNISGGSSGVFLGQLGYKNAKK